MAAGASALAERPLTLPSSGLAEGEFWFQEGLQLAPVGDAVEAWLHSQTSELVGAMALADTVRVQDLQEEDRIQAEYAQGLGALAVGTTIERTESTSTGNIVGLRSSLEHAADGHVESLSSNIMASQTEAVTSVGVMPDIHLSRGPNGRLQQAGQELYSVAKNTIEQHPGNHPNLHSLARTEGLNYHALDVLDKAGYFDKGYVWVVPRLAPKDTPARAVRNYGYFENLSVSWSLIWKEKNGQLVLRPMFTAGVTPRADEEIVGRKMTDPELDEMYTKRLQRRHDLFAVGGMYQDLGLPVPDTVEDFARGFMMHKNNLQDPMHPEATIGPLYDKQLGPQYYQGLSGQAGDYIADAQVRTEALRQLHLDTPAIIKQLIAERHELDTDMAVAYRMAALIKEQVVNYVIDHPEYVPILGPALGLAALELLEKGPVLTQGGADKWRAMIHDMARAQTCGFDMVMMAAFGGSDEKGPLVFQCENGHVNTRPYGGTIPKCMECGVSVRC